MKQVHPIVDIHEPNEMAKFQELRRKDYNSLLISEAMIGKTDGHLDPVVVGTM